MASLAPTAKAIAELRSTAKDLLGPCGFGCGCTRAGHVDALHELTGSESAEALAEKLLKTAMYAHAHLEHYGRTSGFAEVIEHSRQSLRTLSLFVEHQLVEQFVIGDLPNIAARQGSPRNSGRFQENTGTFVYVAYDMHGDVIYVGVTDDLFGRMAGHRGSKRWWHHMDHLEWEEWPDRQAALRKESTLIRRYRPRFNIVGNPDARKKR